MKEIEATWDAFMREVRIGLGGQPQGKYGHRTLIRLSKQETEQLMEELRVALIDSEEPLPEFSPVKA
jgi:hypothetical protein